MIFEWIFLYEVIKKSFQINKDMKKCNIEIWHLSYIGFETIHSL